MKKNDTTYRFLFFSSIFQTNIGITCLAEDLENLEREVIEIRLNLSIVLLATNKMFCIEDTMNSNINIKR